MLRLRTSRTLHTKIPLVQSLISCPVPGAYWVVFVLFVVFLSIVDVCFVSSIYFHFVCLTASLPACLSVRQSVLHVHALPVEARRG